MINCEVEHCIYNKDFFCILKQTQLNSLGLCSECTVVTIPDNILNRLKEKQLENIIYRHRYDK